MKNVQLHRILSSCEKIRKNKILILLPLVYLVGILALIPLGKELLNIMGKPFSNRLFEMIYLIFMMELAVIGILFIFIGMGKPVKSKDIEIKLLEMGFTDKRGKTPILLSKMRYRKCYIYEFWSPRIPLSEYEKRKVELETVMNVKIVRLQLGKDVQHIKVYAVPSVRKEQVMIYWKDSLISEEDFIIKLGESYFGDESCNLSLVPHWLIGGASGSGKSKLLKLILMQCIKKGAVVYLADFKGGVDYPVEWHKKCAIITECDKMSTQLDEILSMMEERRMLFVEACVPNISEYNKKTQSDMKRLIVACDEIAEVLDKTGLNKDEKSLVAQIESKLSKIARQGRAFGIHLILATQRPDADVLKGQIKNNIGLRVCGRADKVLSQIILDNTDGADVISPDEQGMFLTNTGVLFRGYYVEDDCIKDGV